MWGVMTYPESSLGITLKQPLIIFSLVIYLWACVPTMSVNFPRAEPVQLLVHGRHLKHGYMYNVSFVLNFDVIKLKKKLSLTCRSTYSYHQPSSIQHSISSVYIFDKELLGCREYLDNSTQSIYFTSENMFIDSIFQETIPAPFTL